MPFKLNLRFFVLYVASFGIGIGVFQLVTHYGNTQLKAPQRIAGQYHLTTTEPPACIPPAGMVLDILQSGVYLNGNLSLANPTPQTEDGGGMADTRPPLSGQWQQGQLVLSGDAPSFIQCAVGSVERLFTEVNQRGVEWVAASHLPPLGRPIGLVSQGGQRLPDNQLGANPATVSPAVDSRSMDQAQRSPMPLKIIAAVSRFTNHSKSNPAQVISNGHPAEPQPATMVTAEITGRILINPDSSHPVVIEFTGQRRARDQQPGTH